MLMYCDAFVHNSLTNTIGKLQLMTLFNPFFLGARLHLSNLFRVCRVLILVTVENASVQTIETLH